MQIKPYSPIGLLILLETMLLYACTADECYPNFIIIPIKEAYVL